MVYDIYFHFFLRHTNDRQISYKKSKQQNSALVKDLADVENPIKESSPAFVDFNQNSCFCDI